MVGETIPICLDLEHARGKRNVSKLAMQDGELMPGPLQLGDQRCADESVPADQEEFHASGSFE